MLIKKIQTKINNIIAWWKLFKKRRKIKRKLDRIQRKLHIYRRQAEYLINIPSEVHTLAEINAKRIKLTHTKNELVKELFEINSK